MFSSSVIKEKALKQLDVTNVCYDQIGTPPAEDRAETACEGFVPLSFTSAGIAITSTPPVDPAQLPAPPEPPELPADMQLIEKDDLQQQLDRQYRLGNEEGREQAEKGLANVFKALRQGVADLAGLRDKVLRDSEEDLLKLAIMIARKVIQQEVSQAPKILGNIVSAAISDCSQLERITIRLNPSDYAVVAADRKGFFGTLCPDTQLILSPDETISHGGCVIDTTTGTIDARIETQLDEIYRRFMEDRSLSDTANEGIEVSQNVDQD